MWRVKRVLITGADGFIGSHLVEMLVRKGARVKALCRYNAFNYWGCLEDVDCLKDIEVLTGDIRDPYYCKKITKDVDIIFHLAALIGIPYSYIAPDDYVETNIKGTLNLCQAALENDCKRLMFTSTSEVYGSAKYVPIDENHPLQAQSPYSASKIGAEAIAMSFYNAFNLPVTIARPFNTYGPRQSARAVIPTIVLQLANRMKEIKLGNVSPTRDFSYVEDICIALIALGECERCTGEVVNIGANCEISIKDVFNMIKEIMDSDARYIIDEKRIRPEKSEVLRLCCDNTKIKRLIGFEPKYTLKEGLVNTIRWFANSKNLAKYKEEIYNV